MNVNSVLAADVSNTTTNKLPAIEMTINNEETTGDDNLTNKARVNKYLSYNATKLDSRGLGLKGEGSSTSYYVSFTPAVSGTIEITAAFAVKLAAGTNTATSLSLKDGTENVYSSNVTAGTTYTITSGGSKDSSMYLTKIALTPITQITAGGGTTAVYDDATNSKYYAVSVISAEAFTNGASNSYIAQVNANDKELITSTEVYTKVKINGADYNAENFGGNSGDYLFASEITGVPADTTSSDAITNIQKIGYVFKE